MREMDAFEQAYLNGYKAGRKDAVRHGMWVPYVEEGSEKTQLRCSECMRTAFADAIPTPFCPLCGAKMDEN